VKRASKNLVIFGLLGSLVLSMLIFSRTGFAEPKATSFRVLFDFNLDPKGMSLTDNLYTRYIREKTGVQINMESPGTSAYVNKLNIMMASGDYPDAFMTNFRETILQYAGDGMLTNLTSYIRNTRKYPNFKNMPSEAWTPVSDKGKIWAFPYNRQDAFNQVVYVKKEWMKRLGLQTPKTIEEFYQVLKAFREKDPDGNGKKDTYGLLVNNQLSYGARIFQSAFDASSYKIIGGKVTPPEITPQYKEYLKFMNRLVKEGIVDQEFPLVSNPIYREKIKTGKYGMTSNFWHGNQLPEYVANKVNQVWEALPLPVGKNGKPSCFVYDRVNRHYIGIPKGTKNVDLLMKMFNWVLSAEGTRFTYLGVENKEYRLDNGKINVLAAPHPLLQYSFPLVKNGRMTALVKECMSFSNTADAMERLTLSTKIGRLDKILAVLPYYPDLANYNLKNIASEYTTKAVLGVVNIDATWNDYVSKWRSSGGDKAIEFWTNWYRHGGKKLCK
jgi:putative aldouronate transport system substrate-binding protein